MSEYTLHPYDDSDLSWAYTLLAQSDVESRCVTRVDANGIEHKVWSHTFTPLGGPIYTIPRPDWHNIPDSPEYRARKHKRRQRRAAQRKHNRGGK